MENTVYLETGGSASIKLAVITNQNKIVSDSSEYTGLSDNVNLQLSS